MVSKRACGTIIAAVVCARWALSCAAAAEAGRPGASELLDEKVSVTISARDGASAMTALSKALRLPIVAALPGPATVETHQSGVSRRAVLDLASRQTGCPWLECGPFIVFQAPLPVVPSVGNRASAGEVRDYLAKDGYVWDTAAVVAFLQATGGETLARLRDGEIVSVAELPAPARQALYWLMGGDTAGGPGGAKDDEAVLSTRQAPYFYPSCYRERVAAYAESLPLGLPAPLLAAPVKGPTGTTLEIGDLVKRVQGQMSVPLTVDPRVASRRVVVTASPVPFGPLLQAVAMAHGLGLAVLGGGVHVGTGLHRFRGVRLSLASGASGEGVGMARRLVLYEVGEAASRLPGDAACLPDGLILRLERGAAAHECVLVAAQRDARGGPCVVGSGTTSRMARAPRLTSPGAQTASGLGTTTPNPQRPTGPVGRQAAPGAFDKKESER